jgi:ankyrin repeat protein
MAEIPEEDLKLLKAAAESKDPEEVREALRCAKKKNRREIGGYRFTAVHRAIYSNHTIAHVLISDRGVKLNKEDTLGHTPLHLGWSGCVAAMLRTGRTDIEWDHADRIGQTPLLYHARLGNETSLTALLALGESAVSMSKITTDRFTALHQVVEQDRRFFPSRHVFPSLDKRCDFVDILLTAKKERAKTARQLQNRSLEDTDLESDVLEFVNTKDILGRSVLHYIAEEGCVEILDKLLDWFQVEEVKNRVDFNAADDHGCAPLLLAVQRRHTDMVRRLLKLPAGQITFDVGVTVSALHPSGLKKYEKEHKQLYRPNLFSKAPTEQYCGTNLTPLHVAVNVNRHFGVAAALLLDPLERTIKPMIDNERWEMFDKVGAVIIQGAKDCVECTKLLYFIFIFKNH